MGYESRDANRFISVKIVRHKTTGLMVGISEDLKGLMIAGHTEAEIEAKIPDAVKDLLEASGERVISVTMQPDDAAMSEEFISATLVANARLAAH